MRVWRGDEPEGDRARARRRRRDATLSSGRPDYDGKGKARVRFEDGADAIVGGSSGRAMSCDIVDARSRSTSSGSPRRTTRCSPSSRRRRAPTLGSPQMLTGPVAGRFLELLVVDRRPAARARDRHVQRLLGALDGGCAARRTGASTRARSSPSAPTVAQRYFDRSPHGSRITLHLGPALETIAKLEGEFDFVFIDADKEGYDDYYEAVLPRLARARPDRDRQHALERPRARPAGRGRGRSLR